MRDAVVFSHFGFPDTPIRLPINWSGEQFASNKSWRQNFLKLWWLHEGAKSNIDACQEIINDYLIYFAEKENVASRWQGTSDHTIAERLNHLMSFREMLKDGRFVVVDEKLLNKCIRAHVKRLQLPWVYKRGHNHGIMVNASLLRVACEFKTGRAASEALIKKTKAELLSQIIVLHDAYGFTREHSVGYQITNAQRFLKALKIIPNKVGPRLSAAWEVVRNASSILWFMMARPDGSLAPLGDTKVYYDEIDEALTSSGLIAGKRYMVVAPDAGFAALRGKFGSAAMPLHVSLTCGWHSKTHKHDDDLSITVSYGSNNILDDPSHSPLFTENLHKGPAYHSVPSIVGSNWLPPNKPNGLTRMVAWGAAGDSVAWVSEHGRVDGRIIRRVVVVLHTGVVGVSDRLVSGDGALEQWFHFGEGIRARQAEGAMELLASNEIVARMCHEGESQLSPGYLIRSHKKIASQRCRVVHRKANATAWFAPPSENASHVSIEEQEEGVRVVVDGAALVIPFDENSGAALYSWGDGPMHKQVLPRISTEAGASSRKAEAVLPMEQE